MFYYVYVPLDTIDAFITVFLVHATEHVYIKNVYFLVVIKLFAKLGKILLRIRFWQNVI